MPLLRAFDPLDPSADQARRWLRDELAKSQYHQADSLLQRVSDWLVQLWHRLTEPVLSGGSTLSTLALVVLIVLIGVLLGWIATRVRREPQRGARPDGVLDDPTLMTGDYRRRAAEALLGGRFEDALLDSFRAIAASAGERTLLDEAPGRTAHEVSADLAPSFPAHAAALARSADTFDTIRYGGQRATRAQAEAMQQLDHGLARTTPELRASSAAGALR